MNFTNRLRLLVISGLVLLGAAITFVVIRVNSGSEVSDDSHISTKPSSNKPSSSTSETSEDTNIEEAKPNI